MQENNPSWRTFAYAYLMLMLAVVPSHVTRADKYKHIKTKPLLVLLLGRLHYYHACTYVVVKPSLTHTTKSHNHGIINVCAT